MKTLTSYNPADGSIIGAVEITPIEEINSIVSKGRDAQKKWAAVDIDERIRILTSAGEALLDRAVDIGTLLCMEMGKSLRRGIGEVKGSARSIEYTADRVRAALRPVISEGYKAETVIQYDPLGVCGIISPWNYPVSMAHWMIIPALTAGNAVVLKPSEETPLVAKAYVEALNEALPENLLQIIFGDEEQGKALVESEVDFIGFTGSLSAGRNIMQSAAKTLKPLIMELGGKDPMIVLEDADIDAAAGFAVANSLENAGQMCISTERIFVHESIASEFKNKVVELISYYKTGPYTDTEAMVGPIINERQRERILIQIEDAVSKGARILAGGGQHPPRYITPTVLDGINENMLVAREETFGPLVCITEFSDIDTAVKAANGTEFGLGAVVFGKKDAEKTASQLKAGMVGINTSAEGGGDAPWVGAKQSGFGYHGSPDGHRQFTQPKVINRLL